MRKVNKIFWTLSTNKTKSTPNGKWNSQAQWQESSIPTPTQDRSSKSPNKNS